MNNISRFGLILVVLLLLLVYLPTFVWMNERFAEADTYYSHGYLVPLVFAYLIWNKRNEFKNCIVKPVNSALFILIPALLVHLMAYFFEINFISGFSLIVALFGLSLYLYGAEITKKVTFPIIFLVFMIPLPQVLIISISFKMKMMAAQAATYIINVMGIHAIREGSIVQLPNTALTVGDPCSGLRSLISLTALGALYAYLVKMSRLRRNILFLLSIPIAFAANIVRIVLLLLVAFVYGSQAATGKFHDFSGFLVFAIALAGLIIAGRMLLWKKETPTF